MDGLLSKILHYRRNMGEFARWVTIDISDPRSHNFPLMKSMTPMLTILVLYMYIVRYGPIFMKDRKPFELQKVLVVYNFFQVLFSLYLSYYCLFHAYIFGEYSIWCQPLDFSRSKAGMLAVYGCYMYFLAKFSELFDTVFFILRKKNNQITFLHVVHHAGMFGLSYGIAKFFPGGNIVFYGMINSMVHTVMYTYYMISAMGPQYQKYLWWKRYITTMQMIQFALAILHNLILFYTNCGFPRWTLLVSLPNGFFMYFLFHDFYQAAYKKQQALKEKQLNDKNNNFGKVKQDKEKSGSKVSPNEETMVDWNQFQGYFTFGTYVYLLYMAVFPHFEV